jgi:hypothetical protein
MYGCVIDGLIAKALCNQVVAVVAEDNPAHAPSSPSLSCQGEIAG